MNVKTVHASVPMIATTLKALTSAHVQVDTFWMNQMDPRVLVCVWAKLNAISGLYLLARTLAAMCGQRD